MKAVTIVLSCAALLLAVALPSLYAVDSPSDPIEMAYLPSKTVMFPHTPHKDFECQKCHHKWDGKSDIVACASSGCHDSFDKKDRSEKSLYNMIHGKGSDTQMSCLACHKEQAGKDKDKRKKMLSCMGSACHPK